MKEEKQPPAQTIEQKLETTVVGGKKELYVSPLKVWRDAEKFATNPFVPDEDVREMIRKSKYDIDKSASREDGGRCKGVKKDWIRGME